MNNEIKVNVYGDKGEVLKTYTASAIKIRFGTVRALMKVLNIEKVNETGELLSQIYSAWEQLVKLLGDCFPEMTEEEWDNVPVAEVYMIVIEILKASFAQMNSIGGSEKN